MPWYFFFRITECLALGGILRAHDSLKAPQREFRQHGLERRFRWYVGGEVKTANKVTYMPKLV